MQEFNLKKYPPFKVILEVAETSDFSKIKMIRNFLNENDYEHELNVSNHIFKFSVICTDFMDAAKLEVFNSTISL